MVSMGRTAFDRVFLKELNHKNHKSGGPCEKEKIKILGIITGKHEFKCLTKLKVDDGTGTITCVIFPSEFDFLTEDQYAEIAKLYNFGNFQSCLKTAKNCHTQGFKYGDCVEMYGVSKLYDGEMQMTVHFYKLIKDVNTETQIILETLVNKTFVRKL